MLFFRDKMGRRPGFAHLSRMGSRGSVALEAAGAIFFLALFSVLIVQVAIKFVDGGRRIAFVSSLGELIGAAYVQKSAAGDSSPLTVAQLQEVMNDAATVMKFPDGMETCAHAHWIRWSGAAGSGTSMQSTRSDSACPASDLSLSGGNLYVDGDLIRLPPGNALNLVVSEVVFARNGLSSSSGMKRMHHFFVFRR